MILVIRDDSTWDELSPLLRYCHEFNVEVQERYGETLRMLTLLGDTSKMDIGKILAFDAVEKVHRIQEPYTLTGRKHHPDDTVIRVGNSQIGGGNFLMIAGPGSVESEEQIFDIAQAVKDCGAQVLRGNAFMSRSSPHAFVGLQNEGIKLLCAAGKAVGLPVITEITETAKLPLFEDVDCIQVGTRNMQNYELLYELGHIGKPIMLRRGPGCNTRELLQSAEYVMSCGNSQIILCTSGIRTFETNTTYTIDIGSVASLKEISHLPVMVDPSRAAGRRKCVRPLALAAAAAGVDGLMIDVHTNPQEALSDGHLALTPDMFSELYGKALAVREAVAAEY